MEREDIVSAFKKQIGGSHYKEHKIQPYEFIQANSLDYLQGVVIKYIVRYKDKNGIEDLDKIIHYCELEKERLNGTK
jgi:hypothetical protein|tara:strand:+ start:298 stop:528 length:231 start_codon:yes stop_codon:yes gene_type:complete